MKLPLVVLLTVLLPSSVSYKVLVFNPAYGASHSNYLGKITDILLDAGHDVTMLIPVYINGMKSLVGSKKIQKIVRIDQDPRAGKLFKEGGVENLIRSRVWTMDTQMMSLVTIINQMNTGVGYQCEHIFNQTDVLEVLGNEHFDLGIAESLFACPFALFDHIGVKTIINAESHLFKDPVKYAHGEPSSISYYPGLFSPHSDKMGIVSRVKNFVGMIFTNYLFGSRYKKELEVIKPFYKGSKTWDEHLSSVAFNFINSNQYLDYASPTLPKTVFVGGMQVLTKKTANVKLSEEWDELLSRRKQNVLISFGSNAYSCEMPDEYKASFLEMFESMPETTFIWKYEEPNATITDHLENVKLTSWMPQNDLLADSRLTLFVTHGGLGSTMELAYQGKPAVIIPLMADQPRNAHMLTRHGGSIHLHKKQLGTPGDLKNAVQTVLNDRKYTESAKRLAKILEEQPHSPKEVVLKHCDFAVKHGALATMDSEGRHLNTFQFYSFDIAFACLALVGVLIILFYFILRMFIKLVRRFVNQLTHKKKVE